MKDDIDEREPLRTPKITLILNENYTMLPIFFYDLLLSFAKIYLKNNFIIWWITYRSDPLSNFRFLSMILYYAG